MALIEVKVLPVGTPTPSISSYITASYQALDEFPDLRYQVTPTSTVLEGNLDQALRAVRRMHEATFQGGVKRVVTTISIDDRLDKELDMDEAVEAVVDEV